MPNVLPEIPARYPALGNEDKKMDLPAREPSAKFQKTIVDIISRHYGLHSIVTILPVFETKKLKSDLNITHSDRR